MMTYSEFRPTAFDARGLGLDDRQDWLVGPVSQTRDSEALERANFKVAMEELDRVDPEGDDHELHRFGHWGPGWFEIVIIRPDTDCHREAIDMEAALADYPVLCEHTWSEMELEDGCYE